jgi:PAS domain S-box-containing protein
MSARVPTSFTAIPLRYSIPGALLLFTLAVAGWVYFHNVRLTEAQVRRDGMDSLTHEGAALQRSVEYLVSKDHLEQVQQEFTEKWADPEIELSLLTDEHDRIIAAASRENIGKNVQRRIEEGRAYFHGIDLSALIQQVRRRRVTEMVASTDGNFVAGIYPVVLGPSANEFMAGRVGILIVARDLAARTARARRDLSRQVAGFALPMGVFAGLIFVWAHFTLSRRVTALVRAARRFASGDAQARARLGGGDELAEISRAFDETAGRVAAAQRVLAESEARKSAIFENMLDALVSIDGKGRVVEWNPTAEQIFGYRREEAVGRDLASLIIPMDNRAAYARGLAQLLSTGGGQLLGKRQEMPALRSDGSEFPVEFFVTATKTDPPLFNAFLRDITEHKRAEARRHSLEEQLRQAQKMEAIGTLAGGIAHDFNNILGVILGNAALAQTEVGPRHGASESLSHIVTAGRRAKGLVQQILAFSRQTPPEQQILSLPLAVEENARLLRALLPASVELTVECAADIPNIRADPTEIHQVLLNLCTNAWQAMEGQPGSIALRLGHLTIADGQAPPARDLAPGQYATLTVKDTGRGMDSAILERIFDPFFTTKDVGQGTGLGLSVVHGIVKNHLGAIVVASAPGQGSTFELYFPACQEDAAGQEEVHPDNSAAGTDGETPRGRGERILYLDDEAPLVGLSTRMLERLGYRVTGFTSAREALAAFRADVGAFDLIVTDHNMPSISGLDVARETRSLRPDVPVMLSSGFITNELRSLAARAGVCRLLGKPNTLEELAESVDSVLHHRTEA